MTHQPGTEDSCAEIVGLSPTTLTALLAAADRPGWGKNARMFRVAFAILLVGVCLFPALWPGDTPWVNDEPLLLASALRANHAHRLAALGLFGSFGVPYGPLPTQIYQLLLLITHNPLVLVCIRALLFMSATAGGLLWLGRTLRLGKWFIPAVLLSPYLWLFSRLLWDNTFAIPVGVLLLASCASFLKTAFGPSLLTAIACLLALPAIHPMTAPLVAAVGLHLLWKHRPAFRQYRVGIRAILSVALLSNIGYLTLGAYWGWQYTHRPATAQYDLSAIGSLANGGVRNQDRMAVHATPPSAIPYPKGPDDLAPQENFALAALPPLSAPANALPRPGLLSAAAFSLWGGRLLSGDQFYIAPTPSEPQWLPLIESALVISMLGYLLVWAGLLTSLLRLARHWRRREPLSSGLTLAAIGLFALALQMLMQGVMRLPPWTHYLNGGAPLYLLFAWIGVDWIRSSLFRGGLLALLGVSLGILSAASLFQFHRNGGDRQHFGPSLAQQINVSRALHAQAAVAVATAVPEYLKYPQALETLQFLEGPTQPTNTSPQGLLLIRYASSDPQAARLELVKAPSPTGTIPIIPVLSRAQARQDRKRN